MNWKSFGFALLTLVWQSSSLIGGDGLDRAAPPRVRPATEGAVGQPHRLPLVPEATRSPRGGEWGGRGEWFRDPGCDDPIFPMRVRRLPRVCTGVSYLEPSADLTHETRSLANEGFDSPFELAEFTQPPELLEPPEPFDEPPGSRSALPGPLDDPFVDSPEPLDEPPEPDFQLMTDSDAPPGDGPTVTYFLPPSRQNLAARFGWWFVDATGSPTKVGEYQGLESSPFWDVDGLFSNGLRTVNLFASGLDNDTDQAGLDYFGPRLSADFELQRYLHRRDHDPLTNLGAFRSGEEAIRQDLNVGEDYAIRVEDVRTTFQGRITEHIKARLNFHYLRKHGERQANAMQHCFCELNQGNCHVLSQPQRIDWRTVKFEPVIEAKYGPVRAEYSRPMRMFEQSDDIVTRRFGLHFRVERPYAFVPENFTQVDRLKVAVDLTPQTHFYTRLSAGDTRNKFRETHRKFQNYDVRLTNETWDGFSVTGYFEVGKQTNQSPPFLLPEEEENLSVPNSWVPPYGLRRPIDYSRVAAGAEASWQPFLESRFGRGLSLTAGCERGSLDREFADYFVEDAQTFVDEAHTLFISGHVGAAMKFSPQIDSFVRYKYRGIDDPLFGVNRYDGVTNTNLPEHEHVVEIGGSWIPVTNFIANVTFGMENRFNHSEIADFDEENYPLTVTLWWAPTPAWSLSAGYGYFSNWIDQDIWFPSDDPAVSTWDRRRWNYGGRARLLSVGAAYVCSPSVTLSGGVEVVSARDALDPLAPWPDLATYSQVIVDRTRIRAGVDWQLHERISAYFRYRYEEYLDRSAAYNTGRAHMALAGFSGIY